jgi:hypothetical protein
MIYFDVERLLLKRVQYISSIVRQEYQAGKITENTKADLP